MRFIDSITCLVLIYLVVLNYANQLYIGDACHIVRTGEKGECKLLSNCTEAEDDLRFNAVLPTPCGYEGFKQIVCCPIPTPVDTTETKFGGDLPISAQKCQEYSQYVYVNLTVISFRTDMVSETVSIDRCGHVAVPLITGGTPAAPTEFPHSALLGYQNEDGQIAWDCSGSLISRRYVLTAAHCMKGHNISLVRLGELVLDDENDDASVIDIPIEKIIQYPSYNRSSKYNDIALLKLAEKVVLSPYIIPICLPTKDLDPAKSIATGWGAVAFQRDRSNTLLKVVLESFNNTECARIFQHISDRQLRKGIIETQLCAGSRTEKKDTCEGDSGGPLQIYHSQTYCMYTQIGITSFGVGCGTINFPGVYTRLYKYVPWIESIVWAPGEDD